MGCPIRLPIVGHHGRWGRYHHPGHVSPLLDTSEAEAAVIHSVLLAVFGFLLATEPGVSRAERMIPLETAPMSEPPSGPARARGRRGRLASLWSSNIDIVRKGSGYRAASRPTRTPFPRTSVVIGPSAVRTG